MWTFWAESEQLHKCVVSGDILAHACHVASILVRQVFRHKLKELTQKDVEGSAVSGRPIQQFYLPD
jgi:hypothetical protein